MNYRVLLILMVLSFGLAACQTEKPEVKSTTRDNRAAIAKLQTINSNAQTCWMKSKDKEFRKYKVIPELDTRAGKPRILIVSSKSTQGLPQYVIEADGTPARLSTYGPLSGEALGSRIDADVSRWESGGKGCKA
ncbi:MAG: hypothetical protein WBC71_05780 [Salaquimonas sp.]